MQDFGARPSPSPADLTLPAPTIPIAALGPWLELTAGRPAVTPPRSGAVPPAGSQPRCGVMASMSVCANGCGGTACPASHSRGPSGVA